MSKYAITIKYTLDELIKQVDKLVDYHQNKADAARTERDNLLEQVRASGVEITEKLLSNYTSNMHSHNGSWNAKGLSINPELDEKFSKANAEMEQNLASRREFKDWSYFLKHKKFRQERLSIDLGADSFALDKSDYEYFFPRYVTENATA